MKLLISLETIDRINYVQLDSIFDNQFIVIYIQGPPNNFFLKNALKKLLNIFSNFFFLFWKYNPSRLIMETNFIQMAASAGHAVVYTIGPIFKRIIDWVQLYFTNGFPNIVP